MKKGKSLLERLPFFVLIFSVYPSLAFLAWNYREVNPFIVLRPITFSVFFALTILLLCIYFFKDISKAHLGTSIIVITFFSLGHIANVLENAIFYEKIGKPTWLVNILLPLFTLSIVIAVLRSIWNFKGDITRSFTAINVISAFLLASSGFLISNNYIKEHSRLSEQTSSPISLGQPENLPDVYYIILDAYARQDSMLSLGYDNSDFISELEEIGFYVATCSRSNYPQTVVSMASALNMGYLWEVIPHNGTDDRNAEPVYASIRQSKVREEFEMRGYQIITFESGAAWLNWRDPDKFIEQTPEPFFSTQLNPFEYMFLDTTALHSMMTQPYFLRNKYVYNYDLVNFDLDELPKVAQLDGPKFVHVHMLTPHRPNIFLPDGSINLDTDYYKLGVGEGITDAYDIQGYINNTKFINSRLPDVIREIIQNSRIPPIVIIQSDHGYQKQDIRFNNLNTYYFPDGDYSKLYPSITPINSFRLVFNQYFDTDYPLLEDQSVNVGINRPYGKKIAKMYPEKCP